MLLFNDLNDLNNFDLNNFDLNSFVDKKISSTIDVRFFEILWPETWHLRHWLHVTLETLITLLTIENNIIKNYFVIFE